VKAELVLRRHFRKPSLGFADKADMRRIFLGGIERDHPELWPVGADPEQTKMSAAMPTALSAAMALFYGTCFRKIARAGAPSCPRTLSGNTIRSSSPET